VVDGSYPVESWHFWDRMEEGHLTNNACEGQNNRLASRMPTDHPGTYKFLGNLCKENQNTHNRMEQAKGGRLQR
jgi:hypothetical protein